MDSDGCPDVLPEKPKLEEIKPVPVPRKESEPVKKTVRRVLPNEFVLQGDEIFVNNSSNIKSSANKKLNEISDLLLSNNSFRWRIEGHLDNSASKTELKKLSTARAQNILNYFLRKGLSGDRFEVVGLSDNVPIAPNSTIQGKLMNRRIVIKRIR